MSSPIRTKLHVLASNVDPRTHQFGRDNKIVQDMLSAASFVIDSDVLELVKREDCWKSIKALIEADMVRLPYSPMVIEYEISGKSHEFCYLYEKIDHATGATLVVGRPILMELERETAAVAEHEIHAKVVDKEIKVDGGVYNDKKSPLHSLFLHCFAVSMHLALLMLNTKGIEKEVVEVPASFNKKRAARGKPSIPTHSVVHIGTIYRRDGTAIKREGSGGWHMPMHWRCGYTRRQHFGKGREEEKMVYIPPCIVNFKPDEDAPHAPMRKLKI